MDNIKDDKYYIDKVITDIQFIINHTKDIAKSQLEENEVLVDSVMFRLIQISEISNKLTDNFKNYYTDIPWRAIKGLRNRIVHDYGQVDLSVVYDTIKYDIPEILEILHNNIKS